MSSINKCKVNYNGIFCTIICVSSWCLSVCRIYTLIHVVSYRSTEKDYKQKDDVSNNIKHTHRYTHKTTGNLFFNWNPCQVQDLQRADYIKGTMPLGSLNIIVSKKENQIVNRLVIMTTERVEHIHIHIELYTNLNHYHIKT